MDEYPDPDEEFELMYGDELEILNERELSPCIPVKTRKSLNFNTPSTSKAAQENGSFNVSQSLSSFEKDFSEIESQPLTNEPSLVGNILRDCESNRKRTVDELFGDIDDIQDIFIDEEPIPKKHKGDKLQEDLELIEHIVQLRKLAKDKHIITSLTVGNLYNNKDRDRNNISYRVPKYPFIGMTRFDKERVYIRFHSEEYEKDEIERLTKECSFSGAIGDSFKEVWKDATILINNQIDSNLDDSNVISNDLEDEQNNNSKQLWVDLYRPRKYLELLSDESTNRIMLKWIKLWDKAVFNRKPKIKPMKSEDHNKKKFFKIQELNTNLDEHGRPYYKVALLCGPPGLGKTTLAHMVARHAGYNVVEINASDDRSTEAFKTSLENATQMRSVVDRDGRPNCLVFDEIDGAPQSSIDFLVKFINGTASTKAKKGKSQKVSILKRPIICICNDVYVPALRALRQIAFVVNFPQTSSARLAERLMEIAHKQQIKTDLGTMMALSEKTNNDVRSCLSALHFFKAQSKPVGLSDVYKANVGQKDVQKGLFAVWQDIFYIERPATKFALDKDNKRETMKFRMSKVLQTVSAFGDYDRVTQGIFENFPHLKLKDSSLEGISESLNWFIYSDLLSQQIHSTQNYTLMSYLQYAFVVWHFIFGTTQKQKINYPSLGYEVKQKENRQRALVSEVLRGMQPSVRAYCQRMTLILDILPLLVKIICPPFRPVSLHLYTNHEKAQMLKVVHTMIDYNLTYIQERSLDGTYAYNLEPNVEEMVVFDKANAPRKTLSYSNKQLIAREIEMEKMRRFEIPKSIPTVEKKSEAKGKSEMQLPNHLQKLKAKTVKPSKPAVTKDFFGRVVEKAASTAKSTPSHKSDIWYQYKEGYSNAVRKRITISSLR